MRLLAKFGVALFGVLVVFLGLAAWALASIFGPAFADLEARQHAQDVTRIEARLQSLHDDLTARVRDYAEWDDTREFIVGRYPAYVADNFGAEDWLSNYNIDLAVILDDHGRALWQAGHDAQGRVIHEFDTSQLSAVRRALALRGAPVRGVIWSAIGPMLFTAMPATGTTAEASPRGMVLFGRVLRAEALAEQVQLDVQTVTSNHIPQRVSVRSRRGAVSTWIEGAHTTSVIPLRDAGGTTVGAVVATRTRDIVALGQHVIGFGVVFLTVLGSLASLVVLMSMRRLVVTPIKSLEDEFNRQSCAADISLVSGAEARDEIGGLKRAYNQLVSRVHQSREEAREAYRERATAEAANQMKSQFLANMSHELRTPLNAIIGYVELTMEQLDEQSADVTRGDLEKVISAARHQLRLINEVLDLARIEAGGVMLEIDEFDGARLIEETVRLVQPLAKANRNQLRVEIEGELGVLSSDAFRLKQCLINVAGNACKFTEAGAVTVSARKAREGDLDMLEVKVADTGIGMTPEQVGVLFEPFVQADSSITRRYGGSGLGLSITRNVVQLLGGRIEVESAPGQGSTFTLTVPVGHAAETCDAPSSASLAEVA